MTLHTVYKKMQNIWDKNSPELKAYWKGDLQRCLRPGSSGTRLAQIPVFVFHSVEAARFEAQLRYLADNSYHTLDGDGLLRALKGQLRDLNRSVALTFDDATGSAWAVAYPLLKKYGFQAILFVIPGLVPDDNCSYPNLEDVWRAGTDQGLIAKRERIQPLCTWKELTAMHESGVMDLQSHSYTHARTNISPKVVDYLHPGFDTYFYENINIPLRVDESDLRPRRELRLGQPVYQSMSRMAGEPRYFEDSLLNDQLAAFVARNGGRKFFDQPNWRRRLKREHRRLAAESQAGSFETNQETRAAIQAEFSRSKQALEDRLPGKKVAHFCYPWFQGSDLSDQIAEKSGYQAVYYGIDASGSEDSLAPEIGRIQRISEEYLFCLPGKGRRSRVNVWTNRFRNIKVR